MRDKRWDFLYDRQKQPVKEYILEQFVEHLAGELRAWPPPFVEWVTDDLRKRWEAGLEGKPREQVVRFALEIARLELENELEAIDNLMRNDMKRYWQSAQEEAAGHLLVRFVTEKLLSLKEYAEGAKLTRHDLATAIGLLEKKLFLVVS